MRAMARAALIVDASLRSLGAVEYLAVRNGGRPQLAIAAVAGPELAAATALLDDIAATHRRIAHPRVPALVGRGTVAGRPCVLLDCDARSDLAYLASIAFEQRIPIGLAAATGFSLECLEMLHAIHDASGPCIGAFNAANVLVSPSGRFHFVGWGHPLDAAARARLLAALPPSFLAPEVGLGAAPLPGSDLTAATLFFHSFLNLGQLPAAAQRGMRGEGPPGLAAKVAGLIQNSHATRPEERSIPRFLSLYREILAELSITPDASALETLLASIAGAEQARRAHQLELADDGRWFRLGAASPVDLTRRGTQRRLLLALARLHVTHPARPVSWQDLFTEGWPEQRSTPESARSRVYVAISALRTQGLREVLHTSDAGYFLAPGLAVAFSSAAPAPAPAPVRPRRR